MPIILFLTLDVEPHTTRDLLKKLYQKLMPKELRHNLGEYYTPDWLAERLLNMLGFEGNPDKCLFDVNDKRYLGLTGCIIEIERYRTSFYPKLEKFK